jgi:HlyD family secretion protein
MIDRPSVPRPSFDQHASAPPVTLDDHGEATPASPSIAGEARAAAPPARDALRGPAAPDQARTRPRLHVSKTVAAVGLGLAAIGIGLTWWAAHRSTALTYVTAKVTRGSVARAVTASGTINPVLNVQVGTYVSGVITVLYCDYNTRVRKGQICAKIDPRPYQTVVDQEQANLATATAQLTKDQANLTYAKLSYDRAVALQKQDYVTQDSADRGKNAYDQAVAQIQLDDAAIDQHRAALKAAQVNLGYTDIVSPVDGTVVSRNVTMGQTVAASFQTPTLFVIAADLTKMEVDANVSESDIGGIAVGDTATFTVEAFPNRAFVGTVAQVRQSPQSVQNVITYDVVVAVTNTDLSLKPGMTATCHIVTARRDQVLRVPDPALRYTPGGVAATGSAATVTSGRVWLLQAGHPVRVPVTLGLDDDSFSEVVHGNLREGDLVVTSERSAGSDPAAPRLPKL